MQATIRIERAWKNIVYGLQQAFFSIVNYHRIAMVDRRESFTNAMQEPGPRFLAFVGYNGPSKNYQLILRIQ
jgi:hypothetical protein